MNTNSRKRHKLCAVCIAMLLTISATGCTSDGTQSSGIQPTQSETVATEQNTGALGDYAIEIGDYVLTKTYDGKDAIVINMKYTNNSDDAMSYMSSLIATAYQDGVELSTAIIMDNSVYDAEQQMKELKTGASIDVQVAYELSNTTSDVEFKVEEFISFSDAKVEKTFAIAQ